MPDGRISPASHSDAAIKAESFDNDCVHVKIAKSERATAIIANIVQA
jgi:hypothetical protein